MNEFATENFIDDTEKMRDFPELTKERFLQSYSYLTEDEYNNTAKLYYKIPARVTCLNCGKEFEPMHIYKDNRGVFTVCPHCDGNFDLV